jgi:hypothetical protein
MVIATPVGPGENFTTYSRDKWIAANQEGREKDRYFKYISEYTLESYGAVDTGEVTDAGEKIYAWTGTIKTADGKPLTLLDGTTITSPGYYDFTRRNDAGDGVEYLYQTVIEKGIPVDYIVGMRFFLTNNMYGDNDVAADNIRDPGAPIQIMTELGVITTYSAYASYENVNLGDSITSLNKINFNTSELTSLERFDGGQGVQANITGNGAGASNAPLAQAAPLAASQARGGSAEQFTLARQGGGGENPGDNGDQASQGTVDVAKGAGAQPKAKPGQDGGGDQTRLRGLKLDPIQELAAATTAEPGSLLEQLSETNILGTNLLDALALGAGVLYLLYGPKAIEASKGGLGAWMGGLRRRRAATASSSGSGERAVLALFVNRQENGRQQLVAARVGMGSLTLVAQQELSSNNAIPSSRDLEALLEQLPSQSSDLLLLDPRLNQAASTAVAQLEPLAPQRLALATELLDAPLAACSDNDLAQLRAWLNKPSASSLDGIAMGELLLQRQQAYAANLPAEQATVASMIELSLALAWSQRQR